MDAAADIRFGLSEKPAPLLVSLKLVSIGGGVMRVRAITPLWNEQEAPPAALKAPGRR